MLLEAFQPDIALAALTMLKALSGHDIQTLMEAVVTALTDGLLALCTYAVDSKKASRYFGCKKSATSQD